MNKRFAIILACCAAASVVACNETVDWKYTESCENDEKQCRDASVMQCIDGVWTEAEKCEGDTPVCDAETHTCVAKTSPVICANGSKKCEENTVYACTNGNWIAEQACSADQTCNSTTYQCDAKTAPAECTAGDTKCDANNNLVTCGSEGTWGTGVACAGDTPVCGTKDGKAACVEQPAATCQDSDDKAQAVGYAYCNENGKRIVCGENGKWSEDAECLGKVCVDGNEGASATCRDYDSCMSGNDEYSHNAKICDGDAVKICNDGEWTDGENCATINKKCDTANNVASCRDYNACTLNATTVNNGADACDGDVLKTCNDGKLEVKQNCANNSQICDAATKTCKDPQITDCTVDGQTVSTGKSVCSGVDIVTCNEGATSSQTCTTDVGFATAKCDDSGDVPACDFICNDGYYLDQGKCSEKYTTVKQIRDDYSVFVDDSSCNSKDTSNTVKDAQVEITGVVTGIRQDDTGFYIQDTTGGIQVYCSDKACIKYSNSGNMTVGDSVKVVADGIGQYWCEMQIRQNEGAVSVEKLDSALDAIAPDTVTIQDLNNNNNSKNKHLGKLVKIADATAGNWVSTGSFKDYRPVKQNDAEIAVASYLMDATVAKNAMTEANIYDVTGVLIWRFSKVRVAPRSEADFVEKCETGKCKDGNHYACKDDNTYDTGESIPENVANGSWSCQPTGWTLTCTAGYKLSESKTACETDPDYCTAGVCSESNYKPCDTATNTFKEAVSKPEAVDNGTWNCDAANGWTLTCNADYQLNEEQNKCEAKTTPSECTDTETKCENTTDGAVVSTCETGSWKAAAADNTKSCAGNVLGECKNGANRCATDGTASLEICANGAWTTDEACSELGVENATEYQCNDGACSVKTCDAGYNVGSDGLSCVAASVPADDWSPIVSITVTKAGDNPKCVGVENNTGTYDYLNCGHFANSFDPNVQYIVYELTDDDIAKLAGKTQVAADFEVATQSSSVLKKVNYQFFNNTTAIGTTDQIALNKTTLVRVKKYAADFTETSGLQLRIWPNPEEATGSKSLVRLHSVSIYAK